MLYILFMQLTKQFNFLSKLAGQLNSFYKKKSNSFMKVENKGKNKKNYDPVTNFDKGIEKFIRTHIQKKFKHDGIIGEEFPNKVSKNDFTWCIDPIDGTRAFVIGAPTWSNLIGLSYLGQSVIGLANFPELDKHYVASQKDSFVIKKDKKTKIKTSNAKTIHNIKMVGNFHGVLSYERQKKIIKKLGWSFRLAGFDALNFCLMAEGKIDAVIEANLKPYDILPLVPIVKNAGGIVTNWNNEPAEKGGHIVAAANKVLHRKLIKLLKPFRNI